MWGHLGFLGFLGVVDFIFLSSARFVLRIHLARHIDSFAFTRSVIGILLLVAVLLVVQLFGERTSIFGPSSIGPMSIQ